MEIGSMDSTMGMMDIQGMRETMSGQSKGMPDAEEMSSKFMESMDANGDGVLGRSELSTDGSSGSSEVFDALDTDEDGVVSQAELNAGMQSKLDSMKGQMQSGGAFGGFQQSGENDQFQQLLDMVGRPSEDQASGAQSYSRMQESMYGGGTGSAPGSGLNVTA